MAINIELDKVLIEHVYQTLQEAPKKARLVLKRSVNDTAKWSRNELAKKVTKSYAVSSIKKAGIRDSMKIDKGTTSKPTAIIKAKGGVLEIKDFKASPGAYSKENQKKVAKGKVLKSSGMKALKKGKFKAFIAKFRNGHESIVSRVEKGQESGRSKMGRRYIKKILSPSVPGMIGDKKRVFDEIEIQTHLRNEVMKNMEKELRK